MRTIRRFGPLSGMTLVEVMIAMTILAVIMGAMLFSLDRESKRFNEMVHLTARERTGDEMLTRINFLMEFAAGATPTAFLAADLPAGSTGMNMAVDTNLGYPPDGVLLLDPGNAFEERITYTDIDQMGAEFVDLGPGAQCTTASAHLAGSPVHWAGMALAIDDQVAPTADMFDGQALSDTGAIFFRGDGTGFSFRLPTDENGGDDFFDDDGNIKWGATVGDTATLEGWAALRFTPVNELREDEGGRDLNRDGDIADVFDVGRIEMVSWNAYSGGMQPTSVALCPPIIVQEQCAWGRDLNADGFDDPIFLWLPAEGRLEIQFTMAVGSINEIQVLRTISSTLALRNGALE